MVLIRWEAINLTNVRPIAEISTEPDLTFTPSLSDPT